MFDLSSWLLKQKQSDTNKCFYYFYCSLMFGQDRLVADMQVEYMFTQLHQ